MNNEHWHRTWEVFHRVLELEEDQRSDFIAESCGGDSALRLAVESLLAGHEDGLSLLDRTPVMVTMSTEDVGPGGWIGPYLLQSKLGEGGMGVVYQAHQKAPLERIVALKLIQVGMNTREVMARFELERQALARLDHPHIAKVLDAGATAEGRPYFVMELVDGLPLHHFCDRHQLSTKERLRLFVPICQAVHHAHQKGIIHRDLKPSNVLVAMHDGQAIPKVIDFGVARAVDRGEVERTHFTEHGRLVGTPDYMSPEQAEGSLDIDIRSDVYSLGVLLYQLLTGCLPSDPAQLRQAAFEHLREVARDRDPSTPSTRVSTLGRDALSVANHRRTDPTSLRRELRGDLDWIIMCAMDRERERRYGAASELAQEIERHLQDEPVQAGPPGWLYRGKKFVQRHRFGAGVFMKRLRHCSNRASSCGVPLNWGTIRRSETPKRLGKSWINSMSFCEQPAS